MPKHVLAYSARLYDTEGDLIGNFSKPPVLAGGYPEFILANKELTKMKGVGPGKEPDTDATFPRVFRCKGWVDPLVLRFVERVGKATEEAEGEESEVVEVKPDPFVPKQEESATVDPKGKLSPELTDLAG